MFTVYTRSPQKKKTTITQYLYGTKKYRWLNDVCQWHQYQQDTQWSKQKLQQGIVQQSVAGSCITSYLSRVKLDQIQYLQDNQVSAKAQYNKDIQGNYQTQDQNKNCKCGDLYRVYVKRTAQWNSDRCKWRQPSYQLYYTVNEQVSDQAVYERDSLGCITKIEQSLYMNRLVSSYQLQQFGGLQNLTVFPQQTMQEIEFMNWVPMQQQETCLCSPVVYNFYRYRRSSLKDTAWTTDSLTYQCSTDDLPVFIQGYKQQDQSCYTRSQQRQFIQSIKKKLSQQDIQEIKNQLQQQDIENPPQWSVLQQPPTCSSVYRIDRHYLFNCQEVKWEETYTDDYGFVSLGNGFSLSDSNYVRTYYQNDDDNLDYQTAYLQYVGQQAVLHVRIAKAFSDKEATKQDAVTKRYLNPKKLFCCNFPYTAGNSVIKDSTYLFSAMSNTTCMSLFRHNNSYFIQLWNTAKTQYFFSILIGKIRGTPICMNYVYYQTYFGQGALRVLTPSDYIYLLTTQAIYAIVPDSGLCQLIQWLPVIFTSILCTTGSCAFIATTQASQQACLYYWGYLGSANQPYIKLSSMNSAIYKLAQTGVYSSIYASNLTIICLDTVGDLGDYNIYTDYYSKDNQLQPIKNFKSALYQKINAQPLPSVQAYTVQNLNNRLTVFKLPYSSSGFYTFQSVGLNLQYYPHLQTVGYLPSSSQLSQGLAHCTQDNKVRWYYLNSPQQQDEVAPRLYYRSWRQTSLATMQYDVWSNRSPVLLTNQALAFCKKQIFGDYMLLRPTANIYNPALLSLSFSDTMKSFTILNRSQLSLNQNYLFRVVIKFTWQATTSKWAVTCDIAAVTQLGTNIQGYNQSQTQYTAQVYVNPAVTLSSLYFKRLKPGLPYKGPFYPDASAYIQPNTVYVEPSSVVKDTIYKADSDACKAAYGQLFTGQTISQPANCYCVIYTDASKTQTMRLQGQCTETNTWQVGYQDLKVIQRPAENSVADIVVYNCLVANKKSLATFYTCRQHLYCIIHKWAEGSSIVQSFPFTMDTSYTVSTAQHPTIFTYIQYRSLCTYNIYTAYLSQDKMRIQIKGGYIDTTDSIPAGSVLRAPSLKNYSSYYNSINPSGIQWKAMTRQFTHTVCFMSPTHIGYLSGTLGQDASLQIIELDQQYSDQIDSITAPWFVWGAIFVTMTKDRKQVVFISFDGTDYTKHIVNVNVPDDQPVYVTGVASYTTQQIGVVLGPYTVCTAKSDYRPYQQLTLVKYKRDGQTYFVSCNRQFTTQNMSAIPGSRPDAYNSCSGMIYQFSDTTVETQQAKAKSYDKDMVICNLSTAFRKYVLDIKTETVSIASVST